MKFKLLVETGSFGDSNKPGKEKENSFKPISLPSPIDKLLAPMTGYIQPPWNIIKSTGNYGASDTLQRIL